MGFPRERDRCEVGDDAGTQWPRHFMAKGDGKQQFVALDREEETSSAVLPSAL